MRLVLASLAVAVFGCGGHPATGDVDAPPLGDDAAVGGDDAPPPSPDAPGPRTVALTLTNRPTNAVRFTFLVAYEDGNGAWALAPAPVGDTYFLSISSAAYSVAYTCISPPNVVARQLREVTTASFTIAERTSLTLEVPARCSDRTVPTALSGTISNRPNLGGGYFVEFGDRIAAVSAANGGFQMETPPGTHDLLVMHATPTGSPTDVIVDQVAIVRDVTVAGPTTQDVDFATAAPTQQFAVTIGTTGGARVLTTTLLYSAGGTSPTLIRDSNAPFLTGSLAASQMLTGDLYDQAISVGQNGHTEITTTATATPAAQTFVPPAALGTTVNMISTSIPYPRISSTWPAYGGAVGYGWGATQNPPQQQCAANGAPCTTTWSAQLSPGAAAIGLGFQMPALANLAGWSPAFQFVGGAVVTGSVQAMTSSDGLGDFPALIPSPGTHRVFARRDWTITP